MRQLWTGRQPPTGSGLAAGVAAALATISIAIAGCSSEPAAAPVLQGSHLRHHHHHRATPPARSPAPMMMGQSAPVRMDIPAIGVDSQLIRLGLQADGTLAVPPDGFPAGWYTGSPTPGQLGPAIIAGHVHWDGVPGVFYHLAELQAHDVIKVWRKNGSSATFRVTRIAEFPKDKFPTHVVYGNIDHAGLRLITCGGFDSIQESYNDNVVVFADLVRAHTV